jgi:hypothetical protein
MSKYKYSRYLGDDFILVGVRIPRHLVDKAKKDSVNKHLSFNKRIVELFEREFGEAQKEEVIS